MREYRDELRFLAQVLAILTAAGAMILWLAGCSILPGAPTPVEEPPKSKAQAYAIEQTHALAQKKGVRLDAVIFKDPPPDVPNAAGWAVCGQHVVAYAQEVIELPWIYDFIPAFAAHEVCHLYYKDNLPCKDWSKDEEGRKAMENRAEMCGRELLK